MLLKTISTKFTKLMTLKPLGGELLLPLQIGLMILGELSKGLMFSLFAVGDVCLASWTRHSFAMQKKNNLVPVQFQQKRRKAYTRFKWQDEKNRMKYCPNHS